ncbi:Ift52, partial [Symbiodinium sp. KB8]
DSDPLPKDFTQLFEDKLFKFDMDLVPEVIQLYEELNVKHEPLTLIPPQFEAPLPPLAPAVFPPTLREPHPPALDQFDLDEQFASQRVQLAQLTNKCQGDDDVEFYVREAGEILGVTAELPDEK